MPLPGKSSLPSQDTPLLDLVFQRIEKKEANSIPFSEYMDLVLYDPECGYYSRPISREVGRQGDFYTSVSVGETYGFLLSEKIRSERADFLAPGQPFRIVEQGAHDGQLAIDIVSALSKGAFSGLEDWEYCIVEPRPWVRAQLQERFKGETEFPLWGDRIRVVSSLQKASFPQGIFLCNELLDAFPFDRVRKEGGRWKELQVGKVERALDWVVRPLRPEILSLAERLPGGLPEGYETEICPAIVPWMKDAASLFEHGVWWFIDYGFEADDYYAPHRTTGTFRCFRDHRASENPFEELGQTDITAHVDFSLVRECGEQSGLTWDEYTDQHHFLTEAARDWLLSMEGQPPDANAAKQIRQFQSLTHPGMMGKQFKIATLRRPRP